jgi:Predicted metal-binding, possibly nucleic acid-binding protein
MIIDVTRIEGVPLPLDVVIPSGEIDLDTEFARLTSDVAVKGEVTKHIAQTDVRGEMATKVEIDCTRCLQPVAQELKIPFDVSFITPEYDTQAKEAELNKSDLEMAVFEGDKIDLTELVREQILLNLPEQTFCKENCKGLCPKCGGNLNLVDCKCEENEIDPRWAALQDLK